MTVLMFQYKSFMEDRFPFKFHLLRSDSFDQAVHMHDYIQLVYVLRGTCKHLFCGKELSASKGDMFVVPPFAEHALRTDNQAAEFALVDFVPSLLADKLVHSPQLLARLNGIQHSGGHMPVNLREAWLHIPQDKQDFVEQLLLDMENEVRDGEAGYEFSLQLNVAKLLLLIERELGKADRDYREAHKGRLRDSHRPFDTIIRFLSENYMKEITLEHGAELANMAPAYFSHQFKRTTGTAFIDRLHDVRIERARELIMKDRLSMTDICYEVGFRHLSHFIRTFKKKTGLTPTAYKKALLDATLSERAGY